MCDAAERFTDGILVAWDSREPWEATASRGLSDVDAETLRAYCGETGDDYGTAEAEVLAFVRAKVA